MSWIKRLEKADILLAAFYAEREEVLRDAFEAHGWNMLAVARAFGKSASTVQRWLCRHKGLRAEYDQKKRGGLSFGGE